jgi:hypothetical protein
MEWHVLGGTDKKCDYEENGFAADCGVSFWVSAFSGADEV